MILILRILSIIRNYVSSKSPLAFGLLPQSKHHRSQNFAIMKQIFESLDEQKKTCLLFILNLRKRFPKENISFTIPALFLQSIPSLSAVHITKYFGVFWKMKFSVFVLLIAFIVVSTNAQFSKKLETLNVDQILKNERILSNYVKCLLDKGWILFDKFLLNFVNSKVQPSP